MASTADYLADIPAEFFQEGDWLVCESKSKNETTSQTKLPTWKHSLERTEYYKVVKLFINDLQDSENVGDNFIFKRLSFAYVYFTGTVVSLSSHKEKICLEVSDGSNGIICMIEQSFLNAIEQQKIKYGRNFQPGFEGDKNSAMLQAARMTYNATRHLTKHTPRREDINVGHLVKISGKLGEHNGKKYVFVDKINVCSVKKHCDNITCILKLHNNEYEALT